MVLDKNIRDRFEKSVLSLIDGISGAYPSYCQLVIALGDLFRFNGAGRVISKKHKFVFREIINE